MPTTSITLEKILGNASRTAKNISLNASTISGALSTSTLDIVSKRLVNKVTIPLIISGAFFTNVSIIEVTTSFTFPQSIAFIRVFINTKTELKAFSKNDGSCGKVSTKNVKIASSIASKLSSASDTLKLNSFEKAFLIVVTILIANLPIEENIFFILE